jgi:ketosteroid isomerase-like protein
VRGVASSESSPSPAGGSLTAEAVLAANEAFYAAFEARDFDAMSDVWEHSDRVACTHPGWRTLRGWGAVSGSWYALFRGPQRLQFILTNEAAAVQGDVGWVTVDENLIMGEVGGTVAALNLFTHTQAGWKLVAHLGTPVAPPDDADTDDETG